MECRTSLVIAYRLSTVKNSDAILVLNGGDILERDNHDELVSKDSFYVELHSRQFDKKIKLRVRYILLGLLEL